MSKYHIDFVANERITGGIEMDIDDDLIDAQKEDVALEEVEFAHPELQDIEVVKIAKVID